MLAKKRHQKCYQKHINLSQYHISSTCSTEAKTTYFIPSRKINKIKSVQLLGGNLIVWETTKIVSKNVDSITHVLNWYDKQTTNIEDIMFDQREKLKTSHVCKNIIQIESLFHRLECLNFQKNCDSLNCLIEREENCKIYENKHLRNSRSLIVTKISKILWKRKLRNNKEFQHFPGFLSFLSVSRSIFCMKFTF